MVVSTDLTLLESLISKDKEMVFSYGFVSTNGRIHPKNTQLLTFGEITTLISRGVLPELYQMVDIPPQAHMSKLPSIHCERKTYQYQESELFVDHNGALNFQLKYKEKQQ